VCSAFADLPVFPGESAGDFSLPNLLFSKAEDHLTMKVLPGLNEDNMGYLIPVA